MKISVVTVCYNSEKTIKDTLESVLKQDYKSYEHIIIDGKSSDKTLEIVKSYEKKYQGRLKIVSEKDKGLYDAMNKGIELATGDVIGLLNSDDELADITVLKTIAGAFSKENCDAIYGDLEFRDETMQKVTRIWKSKTGSYKWGWHPPHPTLYVKKEVYKKLGLFNLKYPICADYDFMIRLMKSNIQLFYIEKVLIHMRRGGRSTDGIKGYFNNFKESYRMLKDNEIPFAFFVNLKRTFKTFKQAIQAKFN